jgi:hypothetical protein
MGEYGDIPPDLPALWAALGRCDRAESSVRFVADYERGEALAALAGPMAAAGEPDQAERLVHAMQVRPGEIRDPYNRTRAWTDLAWLATVSGDGERAAGLIRRAYAEARAITQPYFQSLLLLTWARVHAAGGDPARADELASRAETVATGNLNEPMWSGWVLTALPMIIASDGDLAWADALVRAVPDPYHRARATAELAVLVAVCGDHDRADTLLGSVTDEFRHARLCDALAAIRAVGPHRDVDPYRRARALAGLADVVAAGGAGHAWGVSDRAEPLVRYDQGRDDQRLIFAALAVGAAGGERGRAAALADRAEAIVGPVVDPENQPRALVTLGWMVADAGDPARAAELADAAEALVRYTRRYLRTWRVAELAAMTRAATGEPGADGLPELTGTPKQLTWATNLRAAYVATRWGERIPPEAMADLARLTLARWWITNRDDLDGALGSGTGLWNDDNLPQIVGSPRQEDWARKLRFTVLGTQYPDGIPPRVAAALRTLVDAKWWIEHRDDLATELAEFAEASWLAELPAITGPARERKRATRIRTELVRKRWGDKIPPGVKGALDRLNDAAWWIANEVGDGYPQAIDRALGAEVHELDGAVHVWAVCAAARGSLHRTAGIRPGPRGGVRHRVRMRRPAGRVERAPAGPARHLLRLGGPQSRRGGGQGGLDRQAGGRTPGAIAWAQRRTGACRGQVRPHSVRAEPGRLGLTQPVP